MRNIGDSTKLIEWYGTHQISPHHTTTCVTTHATPHHGTHHISHHNTEHTRYHTTTCVTPHTTRQYESHHTPYHNMPHHTTSYTTPHYVSHHCMRVRIRGGCGLIFALFLKINIFRNGHHFLLNFRVSLSTADLVASPSGTCDVINQLCCHGYMGLFFSNSVWL